MTDVSPESASESDEVDSGVPPETVVLIGYETSSDFGGRGIDLCEAPLTVGGYAGRKELTVGGHDDSGSRRREERPRDPDVDSETDSKKGGETRQSRVARKNRHDEKQRGGPKTTQR